MKRHSNRIKDLCAQSAFTSSESKDGNGNDSCHCQRPTTILLFPVPATLNSATLEIILSKAGTLPSVDKTMISLRLRLPPGQCGTQEMELNSPLFHCDLVTCFQSIEYNGNNDMSLPRLGYERLKLLSGELLHIPFFFNHFLLGRQMTCHEYMRPMCKEVNTLSLHQPDCGNGSLLVRRH